MLTTLPQALPRAEFVEHHSLVIDAPPDRVWAALHEARWSDLVASRPLLVIRGLVRLDGLRLLDEGPVTWVIEREAEYIAGGRIARPWRLVPERGPEITSLDELADFDGPGWLKYGTDLELHALRAGRTRLATSTRCEPTDDEAARRFGRYWRLIRPFSGLIRRDLLRAVARRAGA